jgi:hypothetical protein
VAPIAFDVRGNAVTARPNLPSTRAVGIRVDPKGLGDAAGVVAGNRVTFVDRDRSGPAIHLRNADRTLTADVIGNATAGELYDAGVFLDQRDAGGTLVARVANNVIRGTDGDDTVTGVAVAVGTGTVGATVVHNTIVNVGEGIDMDEKGAADAVLDAVVANNLVAGVSGRAIDVEPSFLPTVRVGPNLLFAFRRSLLTPDIILGDPRFISAADLRPGPGSAAIDAGTADFVPTDLTTDFGGGPRAVGGAVDVGAFEAPCPDGTPAGGCPVAPPRPAACVPAECDDGDPCTVDECRAEACVHVVREGLDGARCACERPDPAACAADTVPSGVRRRTAQACKLLTRAGAARKPDRLLRRATRAWASAARLAARRRATRPRTPACRSALAADLRDAERRTTTARTSAR